MTQLDTKSERARNSSPRPVLVGAEANAESRRTPCQNGYTNISSFIGKNHETRQLGEHIVGLGEIQAIPVSRRAVSETKIFSRRGQGAKRLPTHIKSSPLTCAAWQAKPATVDEESSLKPEGFSV